MKTLKKILPFAAAVLLLTSCHDILNKEPLDILTGAAVWEDPALIEAYLAQQYEFTPVFVQDANECITGGWRITAVTSTDFNTAMYRSDKCGGQLTTMALAEGQAMFVPSLSMSTNFKMSGISINGAPGIEYWELPYKTIRNLNDFIERVPNSPMSAEMKQLRVAEARFLRAFNYFAMVKRYGGVPLVTKVLKMDSPEAELYPKRNTEKECYDFILSELSAIAEDLSLTTDYGRPTKEAVLTFKSRVALYAASIAQFGTQQLDGLLGFPAGDSQGYYQQAFDAAWDVIESGKHTLYNQDADKVQNFKNIFLKEGSANLEMIMVKQHAWSDFYSGGNGTSWNWLLSPYPYANGAWGGNAIAPYLEIAEEFEYVDGTPGILDRDVIQQGVWSLDDPALFGNKDPRFYASIWMQDTPWNHGPTGKVEFYDGILVNGQVQQGEGAYAGIPLHGTQSTASAGFGVLKMVDESVPPSSDQGRDGQDYPIFRYAEVLLNYAEAAVELGKTAEADWAINDQIRDRAGMPAVATVDRAAVRHERQVELAFEGHRYWDLRRWRTAFDELNGQGHGLRYILDYASVEADPESPKYKLEVVEKDGATGQIFFEYNYYLPITLTRTGANLNLLENPGYNP